MSLSEDISVAYTTYILMIFDRLLSSSSRRPASLPVNGLSLWSYHTSLSIWLSIDSIIVSKMMSISSPNASINSTPHISPLDDVSSSKVHDALCHLILFSWLYSTSPRRYDPSLQLTVNDQNAMFVLRIRMHRLR